MKHRMNVSRSKPAVAETFFDDNCTFGAYYVLNQVGYAFESEAYPILCSQTFF